MEERLRDVQNSLIKASYCWASGKNFDPQKAQELRRKAVLLNHRHYSDCIPYTAALPKTSNVTETATFRPLKQNDALRRYFKSYEQSWLDDNDYNEMNRWLSSVFHKKVDIDMAGINSIDSWISRLEDSGII
jgi:hypothetical protein